VQGHAFSIDVITGDSVERFWIIEHNEINAIGVLKGTGLSPDAIIKLRDRVPERYAPELGLDLAAIGTYGRRDGIFF